MIKVKAGPDLDALIARQVMGYRGVSFEEYDFEGGIDIGSVFTYELYPEEQPGWRVPVPNFSSTKKGMFDLVEHIEKTCYWEIGIVQGSPSDSPKYFASIDYTYAEASTVELAVCLAALNMGNNGDEYEESETEIPYTTTRFDSV